MKQKYGNNKKHVNRMTDMTDPTFHNRKREKVLFYLSTAVKLWWVASGGTDRQLPSSYHKILL